MARRPERHALRAQAGGRRQGACEDEGASHGRPSRLTCWRGNVLVRVGGANAGAVGASPGRKGRKVTSPLTVSPTVPVQLVRHLGPSGSFHQLLSAATGVTPWPRSAAAMLPTKLFWWMRDASAPLKTSIPTKLRVIRLLVTRVGLDTWMPTLVESSVIALESIAMGPMRAASTRTPRTVLNSRRLRETEIVSVLLKPTAASGLAAL